MCKMLFPHSLMNSKIFANLKSENCILLLCFAYISQIMSEVELSYVKLSYIYLHYSFLWTVIFYGKDHVYCMTVCSAPVMVSDLE